MIDVNLENKISQKLSRCDAPKCHSRKRHVRVAPEWNLIRALARVNTRIVYSLELNS